MRFLASVSLAAMLAVIIAPTAQGMEIDPWTVAEIIPAANVNVDIYQITMYWWASDSTHVPEEIRHGSIINAQYDDGSYQFELQGIVKTTPVWSLLTLQWDQPTQYFDAGIVELRNRANYTLEFVRVAEGVVVRGVNEYGTSLADTTGVFTFQLVNDSDEYPVIVNQLTVEFEGSEGTVPFTVKGLYFWDEATSVGAFTTFFTPIEGVTVGQPISLSRDVDHRLGAFDSVGVAILVKIDPGHSDITVRVTSIEVLIGGFPVKTAEVGGLPIVALMKFGPRTPVRPATWGQLKKLNQ